MDEIELAMVTGVGSIGLSGTTWAVLNLFKEPSPDLIYMVLFISALLLLWAAYKWVLFFIKKGARVQDQLQNLLNAGSDQISLAGAAGIWAGTRDPYSTDWYEKLRILKAVVNEGTIQGYHIGEIPKYPKESTQISVLDFQNYLKESK